MTLIVRCLADLQADDLFLEARNERAGAENEIDVLRAAALEFLAADLADEIDRHLVAVLGDGLAFLRRKRAVALGDGLDRGIDFGIGDIGDEPLDLDIIEAADFELSAELQARRHRRDRPWLRRPFRVRPDPSADRSAARRRGAAHCPR